MSALSSPSAFSYELFRAVKRNEDSDGYFDELAAMDDAFLSELDGRSDAVTAFWVNVYNALVQRDLQVDISLYEHKRRFFGQQRHIVAGTDLSLDDIEHGILRSSKWKYGLGYLPRLFPSSFERTYRLLGVDPRIHFALNCGAESCPPIVAYTASNIDDELERSATSFLQQSSRYDRDANDVWVSRLFLYFRGNFGGRSGIYDTLERYGVIERGDRPRIRYQKYDWTLHKGMYRDEVSSA
ncbi:DUF547 domain-containing protein (plasmid) [Haloferax mediterranei ATCC 33500]|nr:DUF547 domain-containing protein [Haloferax mediterranei]AHZ24176.1 hypothetical protein BM92_18405 [Haloferax mediterranei ATCC 33500]EMA05256.1 hypothetical protein C439_00615 [Haloferax mediterranei ATCC 33500]MDX5989942.1 DUF547 domain-containing protein [Haloferax mediterranei ATCC 33500]QCQ77131.1 DUF547 domain-containing protein [Haloferax mediterranei ATCC 33500]